MSEVAETLRAEATDQSRGLRPEMGVTSLVLTQILYIVGASWVGVAATVGQAHAVLWIAAVLLFFLPLAALVAHLARLMPLEGGVYRWSEAAFGPATGFFIAWNLWCYTVSVLAVVGIAFASTLAYVANICVTYAGSVRLPMVAAWLGQAPGWLGELSKRFGSPVHSAILVAALVAILTVVTQFGAHSQEAFQTLDNVSTIFYGVTYIALFAIPLVGRRTLRNQIPPLIRVAAVSGLGVTVLSLVFALVPIVHVASGFAFAGKIVTLAAIFNAVGLVLHLAGRRALRAR